MKTSYILTGLAALTLAACKPNIEPDTSTANGVDFSKYVSIGDSYTAGAADGSVYRSGQMNSYPSILAEQFRTVGGGEFKQPLLPGESGWPINPVMGFLPRFVLGQVTHCDGTVALGPMPYSTPVDTAGSSASIAAQGPYNNVGVYGIRAIDYLFPGYAMLNPYAGRFYANPMGRPLDEATRVGATFFTIWLGSNDVLGYALSGGDGGGIGGTSNISDPVAFKVSYDSVVNAMTRNGAKGALINIPDIASLPFFTTIPPNGLVINDTIANLLNGYYGALGMSFSAGPNNFIIEDASSPGGIRQIKNNEYILVITPEDSLRCAGWGSFKPIPKRYVLTAGEISNITAAADNFNAFIEAEAMKYDLAFVNIKSYLQTLNTGVKFNGVDYSSNLQTGGAFSLDGVHFTPRGNALVANEIIKAIAARYGSRMPVADVNKYPGARLP